MSDFPLEVDEPLFDVIERGMIGHPRSQQMKIGPSGIGDPCDRSLTFALAGIRPPRKPYSGWKPTVGTAGHAWVEDRFNEENERLGYRRWWTEQKVRVGMILDEELTGHLDLFDLFTKTITDWKFVGPRMLTKYRGNGPSDVYRVQAHAYGIGMMNAGIRPETVSIAFLPRDGEIRNSYVWRAPFDPMVAIDALARCNRLAARLRDEFGGDAEAATAEFENCGGLYCDWCKQPRTAPTKSMFDA
jgi:hypothetical protein